MTPAAPSRRKSATAKRDGHRAPYMKVLTEAKSTAFPAGRMLIPSPLAVQHVVQQVPADYTCPITTGIFLRIVADAAEEERSAGADNHVPWWRVVRDDGALMEKLPGGRARQAKALATEGVTIEMQRGVPTRVANVDDVAWVPRRTRGRSTTADATD
jgi:6-O-methylguanine DNA methyltransferase, DNA binding domain